MTCYEHFGQPCKEAGWKFFPVDEKNSIPYEPQHAKQAGRIESPQFTLDKPAGKCSFYRLTFTAKTAIQGYWWVDFYDKNGVLLPDINSALYATETELAQDCVMFVHESAVSAVIAFVTKGGTEVQDVAYEKITPADAAAWCDALWATLPQKPFQVSNDAFALLPKTKAALNNGKKWKILMLGDSLVNDTWCSNFQALVMRDFPSANLEFHLSVRGSTGVWFYKEVENFQEYVAQHKPDLVMIGGVSNAIKPAENGNPEENLCAVIEASRAIGAEVLVMSPPPSRRWRMGIEPAAWSEDWIFDNDIRPLQRDYQRAATAKTKTAYWDVTTVPCDILSDCPQISSWFSRDVVHNNDRGKQIIGRALAAWFSMGKE